MRYIVQHKVPHLYPCIQNRVSRATRILYIFFLQLSLSFLNVYFASANFTLSKKKTKEGASLFYTLYSRDFLLLPRRRNKIE
jgi:hypothetical protein